MLAYHHIDFAGQHIHKLFTLVVVVFFFLGGWRGSSLPTYGPSRAKDSYPTVFTGTVTLPPVAFATVHLWRFTVQGEGLALEVVTSFPPPVVEGDRVTTSEDVTITISRIGSPVTISMTETSVETTTGNPLSFESVQLLGLIKMKVSGTVSDSGVIEVTTTSFGVEKKKTMPWPKGAVMAEGLRRVTEEKGLEAGTEYSARIFSPGVMQAIDAKVTIGRKKDVDRCAADDPASTAAATGAGIWEDLARRIGEPAEADLIAEVGNRERWDPLLAVRLKEGVDRWRSPLDPSPVVGVASGT